MEWSETHLEDTSKTKLDPETGVKYELLIFRTDKTERIQSFISRHDWENIILDSTNMFKITLMDLHL